MKFQVIGAAFRMGRFEAAWIGMALLFNPAFAGKAPPPETGLVTHVSGNVTYRNDTGKGKPAKAQAFMKTWHNDRFNLEKGSTATFIYFSSGRQERWSGPVVIRIGRKQGHVVNGEGPHQEPQVRIIQGMVAHGIDQSTLPLKRSRSGVRMIRGDTSDPKKRHAPVSRALTEWERGEIDAAKKTCAELKARVGAKDITPEIYLLSVLARYGQYAEMDKIISALLKIHPRNETLKDLREWVRSRSM
jgi:hypothetical protein